jgi:hypothetical protein
MLICGLGADSRSSTVSFHDVVRRLSVLFHECRPERTWVFLIRLALSLPGQMQFNINVDFSPHLSLMQYLHF